MTQSICTTASSDEATAAIIGGTKRDSTAERSADQYPSAIKVNTIHSNETGSAMNENNTTDLRQSLSNSKAMPGFWPAQNIQGRSVKKKRSADATAAKQRNGDICMVTLASMDEISDLGTSSITEDSFNSGDGEEDVYHADQGDTDDRDDVCNSTSSSDMVATVKKRSLHSTRPHTTSQPQLNGPVTPKATQRRHTDAFIVDMNKNSKARDKRPSWVEQKIESRDDLERIFVQNGYSDSTDDDDIVHDVREHQFHMMDFAEKYFNVHYISSGPASAISKTVNFVKRRPNQVRASPNDLLLSFMLQELIRMV